MRKPRNRQRFPRHGQDLYELLRMDLEPPFIWVRQVHETTELHAQGMLPTLLLYDADADPMVYFWPVDKQSVYVQFDHQVRDEERKRLLAALERDGVTGGFVSWTVPPTEMEPSGRLYQGFGDLNTWGVAP